VADEEIPEQYFGWWRIIETSQWSDSQIDILNRSPKLLTH